MTMKGLTGLSDIYKYVLMGMYMLMMMYMYVDDDGYGCIY